MKNKKRGIALLVAVIFMSVMLAFGLTLAALAYKQSVLASTAGQSIVAFYTADAALECALFGDQKRQFFDYALHSQNNLPDTVELAGYCDGTLVTAYSPIPTYTTGPDGRLTVIARISFDGGARCADITAYKYGTPRSDGRTTYLFSEGYNTSCTDVGAKLARIVARGIDVRY